MNSPTISIITPVYQAEAYLPACLDSILGQLFGSLTAHGVDGDINGSAESGALCGVNNFIHRHNKTLSFSKRYASHCSASKAYPAAAGPFG